MTVPVLYFHGFASSPHGRKVDALRPLLAPDGIELHAPDLNVPSFAKLDWSAIVARGYAEGERVSPRAIVGSSLGALVALEVAQRGVIAPLVLVAPALGIADRWRTLIPAGDPVIVPNYATERDEPIHRAFFDQMEAVDVDREPPQSPVTIVMGARDETVPFDRVESTWKRWRSSGGLHPASRLIVIEGGDHGLVDFVDEIAKAIRAAVQDSAHRVSSREPRTGR